MNNLIKTLTLIIIQLCQIESYAIQRLYIKTNRQNLTYDCFNSKFPSVFDIENVFTHDGIWNSELYTSNRRVTWGSINGSELCKQSLVNCSVVVIEPHRGAWSDGVSGIPGSDGPFPYSMFTDQANLTLIIPSSFNCPNRQVYETCNTPRLRHNPLYDGPSGLSSISVTLRVTNNPSINCMSLPGCVGDDWAIMSNNDSKWFNEKITNLLSDNWFCPVDINITDDRGILSYQDTIDELNEIILAQNETIYKLNDSLSKMKDLVESQKEIIDRFNTTIINQSQIIQQLESDNIKLITQLRLMNESNQGLLIVINQQNRTIIELNNTIIRLTEENERLKNRTSVSESRLNDIKISDDPLTIGIISIIVSVISVIVSAIVGYYQYKSFKLGNHTIKSHSAIELNN